MFFSKVLKTPSNRRMFSCFYEKPLVFGPFVSSLISSLFSGVLFTGLLMNTITESHNILKTDLEKIKEEIKIGKKDK